MCFHSHLLLNLLSESRRESASRKTTMETRDRQLESAQENFRIDKDIYNEKLKKQQDAKNSEIARLKKLLKSLKILKFI